jgi:translation initiation factor IF-2
VIIEAKMDKAKGISASLIIKNGTLKRGMAILSEDCLSTGRLLENFLGKTIETAPMGSPVKVVGWDKIPNVGSLFQSFKTKKEAEIAKLEFLEHLIKSKNAKNNDDCKEKIIIPIIIKGDTSGSVEAITHEINKVKNACVIIKIIHSGVGTINEHDAKTASGIKNAIIVGFNTELDQSAKSIVEKTGVKAETFDIIYKLTEWLDKLIQEKTPKIMVEETIGKAKILKSFSREKDRQIVGGRVLEGTMNIGAELKIWRRETEIGKGKIKELQQQKVKSEEVAKGNEFGTMIQSAIEIAPVDIVETFKIVEK